MVPSVRPYAQTYSFDKPVNDSLVFPADLKTSFVAQVDAHGQAGGQGEKAKWLAKQTSLTMYPRYVYSASPHAEARRLL